MKKILPIFLLINAAAALYAIDGFTINDPNLLRLLEAQKNNSRAYAANEAFLESGNIQYDLSKSSVYPKVDIDLDGAGSNSFRTVTPSEPQDIELKNKYALSGTPGIKISQLLPTSGILSGSVSDSISFSGLEQSNSPLQPESDPKYYNGLSVSLGLNQPIYFGDAYGAALTGMEENRAINRVTYRANRNKLIISAVSDYYNLIKAAYQRNLVKSRLETNTEYEKRINREHSLGMWTQAQLNTAKAARLQSEADLLKAEHSLKAASDRIEALYGINLETPEGAVLPDLMKFTADNSDLKTLLHGNNPDNLINLSKIRIAESNIVMEEKNAAWNFSAGGSYSVNSGINNDSFSDSLSLSLSVSAPVLDGGSSANSIKLKENEALRMRENYEEQLKKSVSEFQQLLNNLAASEKLSEIYILQEEAAVFDINKGIRELELGGITQKELLELQIALENIRLSIIVNRTDYNLTVLQILSMAGTDLSAATGKIKE